MSSIIYFLSLYLFAAVIGVQGGILNIKNINIAVDVKEAEWRYFIINVAFADRPLAFQCYNAVLEGAQQIEVSSSDMPLKRAAKWRTSMAMASICSDAIAVSSLPSPSLQETYATLTRVLPCLRRPFAGLPSKKESLKTTSSSSGSKTCRKQRFVTRMMPIYLAWCQ